MSANPDLTVGPTRYCDGGILSLKGRYMSGNRALQLIDPETGEPLLTVTTNYELPEAQPNPGCVWIKTWSENEGVLEALIDAGHVEPTGNRIIANTGAVAVEARLLGPAAEL